MPVDCAEIRDAFLTGRPLPSQEVAAHVAGCAACRELLRTPVLGSLLASHSPPDSTEGALLSQVRARLEGEVGVRARLRSLKTSRRALLVAITLAAAIAPALASHHGTGGGWERAAPSLAILGAGLLLALMLSLTPSYRAARPGRALAVSALSLLIPFALVWLSGSGATELAAPPRAVSCFLYGAALSLPLFALFRLSDRAEQPSLRSLLLLAGACGLTANFALRLHCPSSDPVHLLLGHASLSVAWLLASAAPAALGRD